MLNVLEKESAPCSASFESVDKKTVEFQRLSSIPHNRNIGGAAPSHPFAVCAAELCHAAQISPEAEPYAAPWKVKRLRDS